MPRRYLLFAELPYAFEILRPLQAAARRRGDAVAWFLHGPAPSFLREDERQLHTLREVKAFKPDAVFVPGNEVPLSFPGLKVQVFHGFGIEKKGHFRIRGMFDLFCTFGPLTTEPFQRLAGKHGWFRVVETGWPKTDPLFAAPATDAAAVGGKCILYAPTFSPSLTSAPALAPVIADLVARRDWRWVVKFHPKMADEYAAPLRALQAPNFAISTAPELLPLLHAADVMLTDTSSAAAEFMLLDKPVVAFRNRAPGPHLVNIGEADELEPALEAIFQGRDPSIDARRRYAEAMQPYRDGRSSERVLDAVEAMLRHPPAKLRRKPLSPLRRLKYWRALR
ncbi:MAG TPA: CDP-glycerol glycerophosphotransferase family protein [Rhodanobacteraceae bacterium]|nr:CDP-glycerol glycerophosphotransferase family protein [Rhodanobacteraceae bacterium]